MCGPHIKLIRGDFASLEFLKIKSVILAHFWNFWSSILTQVNDL